MPLPETDTAAAVLTVDLDAVVANWRRLQAMAPAAACAAVVKADAYGLGASHVAPALADAGCRNFFVALPDEALTLRPLLPADAVIYALGGVCGAEKAFSAYNIRPVLNHLGEIARWAEIAAQAGRRLPAAVHIDTGMNRLGLGPDELAILADAPQRLTGIAVAHWISHLACSEEADNPMNPRQRADFVAATARLPQAARSLANSSGIFRGPDYHFDLLRPGAALYGVNPTPGRDNPMAAAVRLDARVLQVRNVDSPMTVGYGAAHHAGGPGRIATIAAGYADGYLRSAGGRGVVRINGVAAPVVGRVSMDLITVDVSGLPAGAVRSGDLAQIIGPDNNVDAVAEQAQTIGYEILTSLGARYRRVYRSPAGGSGNRQ
jgi:alanine racemase